MSSSAVGRSPLSYRPAIESRPPAQTWQPRLVPLASSSQPMLDLDGGSTVHTSVLDSGWMATPRPELPDATAWSTMLAQLLIETLQGLRPIGQLNRWVDERVLAAITIHRRQRLGSRPERRPTRPALLHSVRLQFPVETAVEVAAHLMLNRRSIALAFRLEEFYGRWLCTAVELGPTHQAQLARSRAARSAVSVG
jgi:hypothetical protein